MNETRVVETAMNAQGESYIFSDAKKKGWDLAGHKITDLFFGEQCPPDMEQPSKEIADKNFNLKPGQIRFFRSDIPNTQKIYDAMAPSERPDDIRDLFYHSTTTCDYIVVVEGELVMLVGDRDIHLKAGDVVIQRGAAHAWHNHTDKKASIMGIMIGIEPPSYFVRTDTVQP
jgi:hypothetical protein